MNDYRGNIIYRRELGWVEYNEDYDVNILVAIIVVDASYGYNVMRMGDDLQFIDWAKEREDAIDIAVDRARKEISMNELANQKAT